MYILEIIIYSLISNVCAKAELHVDVANQLYFSKTKCKSQKLRLLVNRGKYLAPILHVWSMWLLHTKL